MEHIPILRMGEFLVVTIQVDMHDRLAMALQDDLTGNIAGMSRVLDAETCLVGMRPAVAITLVELGLSLPGVRTALDVERGMALIQSRLADFDADDED